MAAAAMAVAEAVTDPPPGSADSSASLKKIRYVSYAITVVVAIALVAADFIPLWLGAVIVVADGAFTYVMLATLARNRAG